MTDPAEADPWVDPSRPPVDAIDCGGGVWVSWGTSMNRGDEPLVWHWCTRDKWRGRDIPALPRWAPCGVGAHTLVSRDPFHVEPSVYWPDCCGMHGFIRGGRWEAA